MSNAWGYPYASTDKSGSGNHRSSGSNQVAILENVPFSACESMQDANSDLWTGDGKYFASAFFIVPGKYTKIKSVTFCVENNFQHAQKGAIIAQQAQEGAYASYTGELLGEFTIANGSTFGYTSISLDLDIPINACFLYVAAESYQNVIWGKQVSFGSLSTMFPAGIGVKERGVSFGGTCTPSLALNNGLYRVLQWSALEVQ